MSVYAVVIASLFGGRHSRPLAWGAARLIGLGVSSSVLGILLASSLGHLPATTIPAWNLACITSFVVETICLSALLGTYGAFYRAKNHLWELIALWPLSDAQRQLAFWLPRCIAVCLSLCLCLPTLGIITDVMGMHLVLFSLCVISGALAALGIAKLFQDQPIWLQLIFVLGVVYVQYRVLATTQNAGLYYLGRQGAAILFALLQTVLAFGLLTRGHALPSQIQIRPVHITTPRLSYFIKKTMRSPSLQINWGFFGLTSLGLTFVMQRHAAGGQLPLFVALLVLAAFMSDIRTLASRYSPAEIAGLRGCKHFFASQLTASIVAMLCASPLLSYAFSQVTRLQAVTMGMQVVTACSIGIFAGTVLVPSPSDITSQCLAALMCTGLLSLSLYVPIDSWQPLTQAALYAGLILLLLLAAFCIEYQRNPYTWRKYANHNQP